MVEGSAIDLKFSSDHIPVLASIHRWTEQQDEEDLFSSAFSTTAPKPVLTTSKKLITPKLKVAPKPKQTTGMGMSLSERKAEFEKRKLERMEKRMQQWEKSKESSNARSGTSGGGSALDGWSDFSR